MVKFVLFLFLGMFSVSLSAVDYPVVINKAKQEGWLNGREGGRLDLNKNMLRKEGVYLVDKHATNVMKPFIERAIRSLANEINILKRGSVGNANVDNPWVIEKIQKLDGDLSALKSFIADTNIMEDALQAQVNEIQSEIIALKTGKKPKNYFAEYHYDVYDDYSSDLNIKGGFNTNFLGIKNVYLGYVNNEIYSSSLYIGASGRLDF